MKNRFNIYHKTYYIVEVDKQSVNSVNIDRTYAKHRI